MGRNPISFNWWTTENVIRTSDFLNGHWFCACMHDLKRGNATGREKWAWCLSILVCLTRKDSRQKGHCGGPFWAELAMLNIQTLLADGAGVLMKTLKPGSEPEANRKNMQT